MQPLHVKSAVDAPRERVFDYLSDIANHAEFTDRLVDDFRLERLESQGVGAAARFRLRSPFSALGFDVWAEGVVAAAEAPHLIAIDGKAGRSGRVPFVLEYRLVPYSDGMTMVELAITSSYAGPASRLWSALGGRLWLSLGCRAAVRRLKQILEEGQPSTTAVRVAPG
jgi:uncharacterized protein YndB with AHSA1/START domain